MDRVGPYHTHTHTHKTTLVVYLLHRLSSSLHLISIFYELWKAKGTSCIQLDSPENQL